MDSTDRKILEILQKRARISMKELGEIVSLTSPAVSERVKRLEENGVIEGYRAIVNPEKLNKKIKAFINIDMEPDRQKSFFEFALKNENIFECHHTIGNNCVVIKVMVESTEELKALIETIKKYGKTQTSVILSSPLDFRIV